MPLLRLPKATAAAFRWGYVVQATELDNRDISRFLQIPASYDLSVLAAALTITRSADEITISRRIVGIGGRPLATIHTTIPRALKKEGEPIDDYHCR